MLLRKLAELGSCRIYVNSKEVSAKTSENSCMGVRVIKLTEKIPDPEILPKI